MGARSFDDEIAQVPSRDSADRYFAPTICMLIAINLYKKKINQVSSFNCMDFSNFV